MKAFETSINGYNKEQVNKFVQDVTSEYERMLNNLKARDKELAELKEKEQSLNRTLLLAEQTSNEVRRIAREEGQLIINDAKKNASRILNDALIKADKTTVEAEALQRRISIYKKRLKQVIEEQLDMVDEVDKIDL